MQHSSPLPRFTGGTLAEHIEFVVTLCRFQHHSLPLVSVHYLTWSVVHVALHAIAFTLFGVLGNIALGVACSAWAVRMDVAAGMLFGLMQLAYACATVTLMPVLGASLGAGARFAPCFIVAGVAIEAASHMVFQGYPPRPPRVPLAAVQKAAFAVYFVIVFGLFFMTLDLMMRLLGYRPSLHRRTSALAIGWHESAVSIGTENREARLHRRAIAELSGNST